MQTAAVSGLLCCEAGRPSHMCHWHCSEPAPELGTMTLSCSSFIVCCSTCKGCMRQAMREQCMRALQPSSCACRCTAQQPYPSRSRACNPGQVEAAPEGWRPHLLLVLALYPVVDDEGHDGYARADQRHAVDLGGLRVGQHPCSRPAWLGQRCDARFRRQLETGRQACKRRAAA